MPYEIETGPYRGEPSELAPKPKGRPPRYPFKTMGVGSWIEVPRSEEQWLWHAVRNARRIGISLSVCQSEAGDAFTHWLVTRGE